MKPPLSIEVGRRWLLTILFILLTTMLVLIYMHPAKQESSDKISDYEQKTYSKWYEQLETLLRRQEWDKAKNLAIKILHSSPDNLFARRAMIRIHSAKGELAQAENLCRQVIFKNPEAALTRSNLAVLLYSNRPDEAKIEISIALKLMPEHPVIKYN